MFKKTVFLLLFTMIGCQSKQPQVSSPPSPDLKPHIHVDPLPHPAPAPIHTDFSAHVQGTHLAQDKPGQFTLILENKNGTAAQYTDFDRTHGQRIHVMMIDTSLTDYQHIHPESTRPDKLAIFTIPFTPLHGGDYVIYADVTPDSDHVQRFLSDRISVSGPVTRPVFQTLTKGTMTPSVAMEGFTFLTEIDPPGLRAGVPAMLNITVKDKDGELFRGLEPLMQAFAHLIGFSEDRTEIVHTHPMGREITAENARGGPNLLFHITFPKSGYYRLFLQVRVADKVLTIPFDAWVAP